MTNEDSILDLPTSQNDDNDIVMEQQAGGIAIQPIHFILLCICTIGLYQVWYYYKCWKFIELKEGIKLYPGLRAFFTIIFSIELFNRIIYYSTEKDYKVDFSAGAVFVVFLLMSLCGRVLPLPYALISLVSFLPILYPLRAFNYYFVGDTNAVERPFFSNCRLILMVIGIPLMALLIYVSIVSLGKPLPLG